MAIPAPPATLADVQEKLQQAQADHARVIAMRPKTQELAKKGAQLLVENHFAARIFGGRP